MPRVAEPISIENVILALLDEQPMHGYEIHQTLCDMPGIKRIWTIKQALLYAKLDKLEGAGLVAAVPDQQDSTATRKYLALTPAGRAALKTWIEAPVRKPRHMRQEFLAKLIIARRYGREAVLTLIGAQKDTCRQWNDLLAAAIPGRGEAEMDDWLVHYYRSNRDAWTLSWLNELEERIRELPE